ncbi:hypothetical protein G6F65_019472 [Rhizopus arrhizus]|nr:hypothetical protein G6F65_019472 [Rhizopus arrhizus]
MRPDAGYRVQAACLATRTASSGKAPAPSRRQCPADPPQNPPPPPAPAGKSTSSHPQPSPLLLFGFLLDMSEGPAGIAPAGPCRGPIRTDPRALQDDPAAQANLAIVKHGRLAGRDSPLRLGEIQREGGAFGLVQPAGRGGLAIARLGAVTADGRRMPRHPAGVLRLQLARQQPGMVASAVPSSRWRPFTPPTPRPLRWPSV